MTETYIAEHIWMATRALYATGGQDLNTPRYTDLIDPESVTADTRTAEEIMNDILKKLEE